MQLLGAEPASEGDLMEDKSNFNWHQVNELAAYVKIKLYGIHESLG